MSARPGGCPAPRVRRLAAEAEIALALGDLRWSAELVARAIAELHSTGDARNAAYLELVAARAALRLGRPADAERLLGHAKLAPAAPLERTLAELVRVELAAKRSDPDLLTSALAGRGRGGRASRDPGPRLGGGAHLRDRYEGPTAVITSRGKARTASFCEVCALGRSADVVIDGGGRELRSSGACVPFARKPVLFAVLRALAEAWPEAVPRDALIARAFGARRPKESHPIRLRVGVGRLRKIAAPWLGVAAEGPGYALSAAGEVVLVMPLEESPASRLLSLMHGGEAWSASSLALALDVSERTVQRSLGELQSAGKVGPTGNGRGRRWVRLFENPDRHVTPAEASPRRRSRLVGARGRAREGAHHEHHVVYRVPVDPVRPSEGHHRPRVRTAPGRRGPRCHPRWHTRLVRPRKEARGDEPRDRRDREGDRGLRRGGHRLRRPAPLSNRRRQDPEGGPEDRPRRRHAPDAGDDAGQLGPRLGGGSLSGSGSTRGARFIRSTRRPERC